MPAGCCYPRQVDRVCPLLALAADHRTVVDGVDSAHRCHAFTEPIALERQQQAQLCLTPRHDRCERYLQHVARRGAAPGRATVADGLVSTRMLLAPEPAWRGIAGRARSARAARALVAVVAVIATGVTGVALAGSGLSGRFSILETATVPSASPTASPVAASATPRPTIVPTAIATASPSVMPEPTLDPTPAPTAEPPVPTVPPPPPQTYVVQAGDTLAAIAQTFGTTVAALQAANGIEDPNQIIIGQVLVIP